MRLSWRLCAKNLLYVVLIALCSIAAYMFLQFAFIDLFIRLGWEKPSEAIHINGVGEYAGFVFLYCILPAVLEELIFRMCVFWGLFWVFSHYICIKSQHKSAIFAAIISAGIFAAYHGNLSQLVYQFIMGIIFATIFYKTQNILYSMMCHFINNFFIVTYTFIAGSDEIKYSWNAFTIILGILLAISGTCGIIVLLKNLKKEQNATTNKA
jgi:membrane protease YdiL (CAAX protease family)